MQRPLSVGFSVALLGFGIALPRSTLAAAQNGDAVLNQARQSYYSLHKEGLVSFTCNLIPDWRFMMKRMNVPADRIKPANAILNELHFTMSMAANGVVTTKHNNPNWTGKKQAAFGQITSGMQQTISGAFETWKVYALDPGLPHPGSVYQLTSTGSQYQLRYKDSTADVVTTMTPNFAISETAVTAPKFISSVRPTFQKTKKGFVMTGYTADYKSHNPAETTHLNIAFSNRAVQGFELIRWMHIDATYGGSPYAINVSFTNCKTTRKH